MDTHRLNDPEKTSTGLRPYKEPVIPYLRRMVLADLDQVVTIEKESFSDPWSAASIRHEIVNGQYCQPFSLVLPGEERTEKERIIGYLFLWNTIDDLHIANLAVHSQWRNRGYGEQMIRAALFLAQKWKVSRCILEVRMSNWAARRLYEKIGFQQMRIRKRYYVSPTEDALVLEYKVPAQPVFQAPPIFNQELVLVQEQNL